MHPVTLAPVTGNSRSHACSLANLAEEGELQSQLRGPVLNIKVKTNKEKQTSSSGLCKHMQDSHPMY